MDKWLREQYKYRRDFGNSLDTRRSASLMHRKEQRNNILERFRNIPENMSPLMSPMVSERKESQVVKKTQQQSETKSNKRLEMLKKWKEERDRRKLEEKKKAKVPFKVYHVDHNDDIDSVYNSIKGKPVKDKIDATLKPHAINKFSVIERKNHVSTLNKAKPEVKPDLKGQVKNKDKIIVETAKNSKLNTRSKKNNEISKDVESNLKKTVKRIKTEVVPVITKLEKENVQGSPKKVQKRSLRKKSAEDVHLESKKENITKSAGSTRLKMGEEKNEEINDLIVNKAEETEEYKTPVKTKRKTRSIRKEVGESELKTEECSTPTTAQGEKDEELCYVSPFVTMSRGKVAARKEYEQRKSGVDLDKSSTTDPRSPRAAADYFTKVLRREIERIEEMCREWQCYKDEAELSEDACGLIDMTIGQSNLLITKKFNQFRGLIERCRSQDEADMKIQCEDLHGFWDMIYKQVTDLDKRFANLQDMKTNNWLEKEPRTKTPKASTKKKNKRKKVGWTKKPKGNSLLRETIAAARRNNKEKAKQLDEEVEILIAKEPRRKSTNGKQSSTPFRGILKCESIKSEKVKKVGFQISQSNSDGSSAIKVTPTQKRRSARLSLSRAKLSFD